MVNAVYLFSSLRLLRATDAKEAMEAVGEYWGSSLVDAYPMKLMMNI